VTHPATGDPATLRFRQFTDGDSGAVHRLHVAALLDTNALIDVRNYYADLDDIPRTYLHPGGEFLVGELDGEIVAMGGMQLHPGGIGELRRMRVVPRLQGRGLGRQLLALLRVMRI
jgi:N-acetylglutamate synthase-like GNAT family acetyltransferase